MAVAFCGYFKASLPLLNQLSLFIVWSVLLDTFVIRPLLVPATMGILQSWNWWPMGSRFPAPTKELPEFGGAAATPLTGGGGDAGGGGKGAAGHAAAPADAHHFGGGG